MHMHTVHTYVLVLVVIFIMLSNQYTYVYMYVALCYGISGPYILVFFYISEKLTEMMTSFQSTYYRLLETATKRMDKLEESCEMFFHLEDNEDFKKWLAQ